MSSSQKVLLVPSLMDRMIDSTSESSDDMDSLTIDGWNWRNHLDGIIRDLQALLNTRQQFHDFELTDFPEARRSFLTYGLPEFDVTARRDVDVQHALKVALEAALKRFEPRLINVKLQYIEDKTAMRVACFRLEALVHARPAPRRVCFDTRLDLDRAECQVKEQL